MGEGDICSLPPRKSPTPCSRETQVSTSYFASKDWRAVFLACTPDTPASAATSPTPPRAALPFPPVLPLPTFLPPRIHLHVSSIAGVPLTLPPSAEIRCEVVLAQCQHCQLVQCHGHILWHIRAFRIGPQVILQVGHHRVAARGERRVLQGDVGVVGASCSWCTAGGKKQSAFQPACLPTHSRVTYASAGPRMLPSFPELRSEGNASAAWAPGPAKAK